MRIPDTNEDPAAPASSFLRFDSDVVQLRPGLHIHRLDDVRVDIGGRQLRANVLHRAQQSTFVAIESTDDRGAKVIYYGLLLLCFAATYLNEERQLCYKLHPLAAHWQHCRGGGARRATCANARRGAWAI